MKKVFSNLQDKTKKDEPLFWPRQLFRTADNRKTFSKGDQTKWSYLSYTLFENIHDTIPSYRIKYLPERYNENLVGPTKILLEENNQVLKEQNLVQ